MIGIIRMVRKVFAVWYPTYCKVCGVYGSQICTKCTAGLVRKDFISVDGFYACCSYSQKLVRSYMLLIKRFPSHTIAKLCAMLLVMRLKPILQNIKSENIAIIPLPRTKKNVQEFGHDQTFLIANEFASILHSYTYNAKVYPKTLVNRGTKTHHSLSSKLEREQASLKQFKLGTNLPPRISHLIILDDIITSGSTMRAAQNLLIKAGYSRLICAGILLKD